MNPPATPLTWAAVLLAASMSSQAADAPRPAATDRLAAARAQIGAHRFAEALDELRRVNATDSADWHNLMGYSLRMQPRPDLAGSERHYDAALHIDPRHRGALEYSGELKLQQGDLAGAQRRLVELGDACGRDCDEYRALKQAIERYRAGGGKPAGGW
jgi:Flp pilus assembly protein TadD